MARPTVNTRKHRSNWMKGVRAWAGRTQFPRKQTKRGGDRELFLFLQHLHVGAVKQKKTPGLPLSVFVSVEIVSARADRWARVRGPVHPDSGRTDPSGTSGR